jgi:hypothetical protein
MEYFHATTKQQDKEIITMKAWNKVIGLGITTTVLAVALQTSAQINLGANNSIGGTNSSIAGGNWSSITGDNSVIAGGLSNLISAAHVAIGGGRINSASGVVSTIAGGHDNRATSQGAFVGGGEFNDAIGFRSTIGGGSGNEASDLNSTVGGGSSNTAGGSSSTVGGGSVNTASAFGSTVSGGSGNTASGSRATVPGGQQASASHYGQFAYASGSFTTNKGEAQASMYVLRTSTTNSTQTEMFLDGLSERMTIASGRTLVFEIQVAARSSGNTSAAYLIKGAIDNNGGTTSFLNAPIVEVLGEDVSAWDATVQADDTNDALVLKVTGAASTTIRWVATVRTTEVAH